jgi:hypothetical protein
MPEASPFLQRVVRALAYMDFARTIAQYYDEAFSQNEHPLLLLESYAIFRDRWPTSDFFSVDVLHSSFS